MGGKKQVWLVYYSNDKIEAFLDKKEMNRKLNDMVKAKAEGADWIVDPLIDDCIKFADEEEFNKEVDRFIKRGWNAHIEAKIVKLKLDINRPPYDKIKFVNDRRILEEL